MSLLPRRDLPASWAIKQCRHSHFLFITTDCYLSSQPPLSSLHAFGLKISPLPSTAVTMVVFHWFPAGVVSTKTHFAHRQVYNQYAGTYIRIPVLYTWLLTQTLAEHSAGTVSIVCTNMSLRCYLQSFILPRTDKRWENPDQYLQLFSR